MSQLSQVSWNVEHGDQLDFATGTLNQLQSYSSILGILRLTWETMGELAGGF